MSDWVDANTGDEITEATKVRVEEKKEADIKELTTKAELECLKLKAEIELLTLKMKQMGETHELERSRMKQISDIHELEKESYRNHITEQENKLKRSKDMDTLAYYFIAEKYSNRLFLR